MDGANHACSYLEALEAMQDLVLIKGPESRLLWANKSFREYYGMSEDELRDIVDGPQSDPDDTQQYVRDDRRVFARRDHVDVASEAVTDAHGVTRDFHTVKSPIFDGGEVVRSVGVSRRIDDEVLPDGLSHLDAKALAKPLRLLTSAFPLAIVLTDVIGRVVSTSSEWQTLFGENFETASGDAGQSMPIPGLPGPLAAALDTGSSTSLQVQMNRGGGLLALDVRVGPWTYDDGSLGGAIILAIDITADAEREAELETTIARRIDAERALREINEDLEHFVHIAAHDLREPARRQLMLTDLLVEDHGEEISPALLGQLERLRDQSRKMLAMITGFRALSGIMAPSIELVDVDLDVLVREVATRRIDTYEPNDVTISLPSSVRGYPMLLTALFGNLLENAVVHGSSPPDIRIEHFVVDDRTTFSVSNRWDGDPMAIDASRLFKPFVRDNITTEGSGLGMSICKRVVERHRGRIWLEPSDRFDVRFTLGVQT